MSGYLFVLTCMHVTCSNKILATSQLRPPLWTWGRAVSARPRSKMGHTSAGNMRMSVKKDILLRASTRNAAKSQDKGLVVGVHARPAGLRLWTRRTTWRAWAYVKLQSLCARLRVGDVSTHSGVNSWPFRYRAREQPLLACLRAHLREGLNHRKQKNSLNRQIGEKTSSFFWNGVKCSNSCGPSR